MLDKLHQCIIFTPINNRLCKCISFICNIMKLSKYSTIGVNIYNTVAAINTTYHNVLYVCDSYAFDTKLSLRLSPLH